MSYVGKATRWVDQVVLPLEGRMVALYNGRPLIGSNLCTARFCVCSWYCLMEDILHRSLSENVAHSLLGTVKPLIEHVDVFHLIETLKRLDEVLLESGNLNDSDFGEYNALKGIFLNSDIGLGNKHQLLTYMTRLTLDLEEIENETLMDFVDNATKEPDLPQPTEFMIGICTKLFATYETPTMGDCGFGNGVTAQTSNCCAFKYAYDSIPARTRYIWLKWFPDRVPPSHILPSCRNRVLCVPKSYKKMRTISPEDCWTSFLQEGAAKSLLKCIRRSWLSDHVDLQDQATSRELTRVGAEFGIYATIDLSHASDDWRYSLIKNIFQHTPCLRDICMLRSTHGVLPSGELVEYTFHSAMGSKLCFILETIGFSLIVADSLHDLGLDPIHTIWRVYGDDIIVPDEAYDIVMSKLTQYGFTPNMDKSFHGDSLFRESCGTEAWFDRDITPLRFPRGLSLPIPGSVFNPQVLGSLTAMANNLFLYGLQSTRLFVLRHLSEISYTDDPVVLQIDTDWARNVSNASCVVYSPTAVPDSAGMRIATYSRRIDEAGMLDACLHHLEVRNRPLIDIVLCGGDAEPFDPRPKSLYIVVR